MIWASNGKMQQRSQSFILLSSDRNWTAMTFAIGKVNHFQAFQFNKDKLHEFIRSRQGFDKE